MIHTCSSSQAGTFTLFSLELSIWIAIGSLLFAVLTYWFSLIRKTRHHRKTFLSLRIELALLHETVCKDILRYKEVRESKYQKDFNINYYNFNTLKYLTNSNQLRSFFKKDADYFTSLELIGSLELLRDQSLQHAFHPPSDAHQINWWFYSRFYPIWKNLLNLESGGKVIEGVFSSGEADKVKEYIKEMKAEIDDFKKRN